MFRFQKEWNKLYGFDAAGEGAEGGAGEGASGGAAGAAKADEAGSGASGGDGGEGAGAGEGAAAKPVAPTIPEETQRELDRLKKFEQGATAHVEIDPTTGEVKARRAPEPTKTPEVLTAEQIADMQKSNMIAESAANLIEQNRSAEQKTIDKHKVKDPAFAENFIKARDKMMTLPAAQRTEQVWDKAYAMAAGETAMSGKYEKHWKEQGKREALEEFQRNNDMTLPAGSGAGGGGSKAKVDLSKITLTSEQRDAAVKLIHGGFLNSLDEYKENMVREGLAEVN